MVTVLRELGEGGHVRGIRANLGLGQREGRKLPSGGPGEVFALLVLGAEQDERRGHPDRLVRGKEGRRRGATAGHDRERPVVGSLGEAQTTVLPRDLHPERAQFGQSLEH